MIKRVHERREVDWNDKELKLEWVRPELPEIPMWVAGYGPKALAVAGRVGDGVIIQLADPEIIKWIMGTARASRRGAGRDPAELKCIVCAPSHVGRRHRGRARAGALVPGDGLEPRHGPHRALRHDARSSRTRSPTTWKRKFYDYDEHSRVGAKHGEFVTDEICDRFCVLGDAGQITEKLRELEAIGVDHYSST